MSQRYHFDNDFLVRAFTLPGPERSTLVKLTRDGAHFEMSAIAWYEFMRGPRSPEQVARARDQLGVNGIIPFTDELAERAGDVFRRVGSPRRRASDLAIGVTAASRNARLLTSNASDYSDIEGLLIGPA